MPCISLTTALNPGDLDTITYPNVKITKLAIDWIAREMQVTYVWGDASNGWRPGEKFRRLLVKLDDLPAVTINSFEALLHQKLINAGLVNGTVV